MEKIDLNFLLNDKVRLGESLIYTTLIYKNLDHLKKTNCQEINNLKLKFSNSYNIQKLKTVEGILRIITSSFNIFLLSDTFEVINKIHTNFLKRFDDKTNYIINISLLKFFNEELWPEICAHYFNNLSVSNFIFNFKLKKEKIDKSAVHTNSEFILNLDKWLKCHLLGKVLSLEEEKEGIFNIKIEIGC